MLSDQLAQEVHDRRPDCQTCSWYANLSDQDRAAFDDWLAAGKSKSALWRACAREGLKAARSSFTEHLRLHYGSR